MKIILPLLLLIAFCSHSSAVDITSISYDLSQEVPVMVGGGSDGVWFNTGIRQINDEKGIFLPKYGAAVIFAPDHIVDSVMLSCAFKDSSTKYAIHGIHVGESRKDVLAELGQPTHEVGKDPREISDLYTDVWLLGNPTLLEISFWGSDHAGFKKDTVCTVIWRKAHL